MNHGNVSAETAQGLVALKTKIEACEIPSSKLDETLNVATWNIKEFGAARRNEAALHYIAEVIGQFDLVGIVELRENLRDLGKVLGYLGHYWKAVYSDVVRDAGGNWERSAYLFDSRAVHFTGMAAAGNPPRDKSGTEYVPQVSWWRPPYIASFRAGSFDFLVITTHTRWSAEADRESELRSSASIPRFRHSQRAPNQGDPYRPPHQ